MIRLLAMDVDGTLTDGKIYMSKDGEFMKAFSIKDGYAISQLKKYDIIPVIITGRSSNIVSNRAKELGITEVFQGCKDKLKTLKKVANKYEIIFSEIAYIGDDLNDIECIKAVGLSGCPLDAIDEVKESVDFVCKSIAGQGAVRELIEYIIQSNK